MTIFCKPAFLRSIWASRWPVATTSGSTTSARAWSGRVVAAGAGFWAIAARGQMPQATLSTNVMGVFRSTVFSFLVWHWLGAGGWRWSLVLAWLLGQNELPL